MAKKKYSHADINLVNMAFAIGQRNQSDSVLMSAERIIEYAKEFTEWEFKILSLEEGWATYMDNGGEDYESAIYEWAKKFKL